MTGFPAQSAALEYRLPAVRVKRKSPQGRIHAYVIDLAFFISSGLNPKDLSVNNVSDPTQQLKRDCLFFTPQKQPAKMNNY